MFRRVSTLIFMCTDGYTDTEVSRRVLGCIKQEALGAIDRRQQAYNNIMAETGPYTRLQRYVRLVQWSHGDITSWRV